MYRGTPTWVVSEWPVQEGASGTHCPPRLYVHLDIMVQPQVVLVKSLT